jgi:hypothetical protein
MDFVPCEILFESAKIRYVYKKAFETHLSGFDYQKIFASLPATAKFAD